MKLPRINEGVKPSFGTAWKTLVNSFIKHIPTRKRSHKYVAFSPSSGWRLGNEGDGTRPCNSWEQKGLSRAACPTEPQGASPEKGSHPGPWSLPSACEGLKLSLLSPGTCGSLLQSLPCLFEFPAMSPLQETAPRSCPTARNTQEPLQITVTLSPHTSQAASSAHSLQHLRACRKAQDTENHPERHRESIRETNRGSNLV